MHGAQDSSSFILLHEHSKVFQIVYTNCPGNVCPGKWLSGKRLVREIIDESAHADVRETSVLETSCYLITYINRCVSVCHFADQCVANTTLCKCDDEMTETNCTCEPGYKLSPDTFLCIPGEPLTGIPTGIRGSHMGFPRKRECISPSSDLPTWRPCRNAGALW